MVKCPHKGSREWLKLVDNLGEQVSWKIFLSNDEGVPSMEKVDEIIATYPKTSTVYTLKALNILSSERGQRWMRANKGVFKNNKEQYWKKLQADLQIPKAQVELLKEIDSNDPSELIVEFAAKYGFSVEVKTAIGGNKDLNYKKEERYKTNPWTVFDVYTNIPLKSYATEEEARQYIIKETSKPTQVYNSLSVPGGTNYQELRIITPDITPSIKGHAQFAEANDIGWARVDDRKQEDKDETINSDYPKGFEDLGGTNRKGNGVATKTRRILEVQSDLFQKGRDKKDLVTRTSLDQGIYDPDTDQVRFTFNGDQYYTTSEEVEFEGNIYDSAVFNRNGKRISGEEYDIAYDKYKGIYKSEKESPKNQFLQLLNKDNNWVTFFIKSLIQDSAKRGYEKVLFPSGNTAQKVEGQTTYEEFVKQKKDRINFLIEQIRNLEGAKIVEKQANGKTVYTIRDKNDNPLGGGYIYYSKEAAENNVDPEHLLLEKTQLELELEKVEKEGMSAFSSIFNFYENQITNILKKNYKVEKVTDEYGNTWTEVALNPTDVNSILFQLSQSPKDRLVSRLQSAGLVNNKLFTYKGKKELTVRKVDPTKNYLRDEGQIYIVEKNKRALEVINANEFGGNPVIELQQSGGVTIVRINEALLNSIEANKVNQLSASSKKVDNELRQKLVTFLDRFGISVQAVDNMLERTGQDAVAAADFIHRLVLVANGKEDGKTLPEETAHMAIEMLMDHPFGKRIMQLVENTAKFKEIQETYGAAYKGDLNKLKKEAAGQLLRDVIREQWSEYKTQSDLFRLLNKAWNWVKSQFRKVTLSESEKALQEINKEIAKDIFTENLVRYDPNQLKKAVDPLFQLVEESPSMKSLKKSLKDAIEITYGKIRRYKRTDNVKYLKSEELLLKKLEESMEKDKTALGLLNFVAAVRIDIGDTKKGKGILGMLDKLRDNPEGDPYALAGKLRKASAYAESFRDVINSVKLTIEKDKELRNDKRISALLDELKIVDSNLDTVQDLITEVARPTVARVFKEFAGDRGIDKDGLAVEIDWEEALKVGNYDISKKERFLDAMADAKDEILQIIDKITKAFKEEARHNSLKALHDIINETKLLEAAGFKTDIVAETHDGKVTGNWVMRYNRGAYVAALTEKTNQMREKYGLPKITDWKRVRPEDKRPTNEADLAAWKKDWSEWFRDNTQTVPNVEEVIQEKRKFFIEEHGQKTGEEVFERWLKKVRTVYTSTSGVEYITYMDELQIPSKKYLNKQYDEIFDKNNPKYSEAKERYYKFIYELHMDSVKKSPIDMRDHMTYSLPQVRKDLLERFKDKGRKELKTSFVEQFVRHEGDTEFGQAQLVDEKGNPAYFIPIHYAAILRDPADLSLDISASVSMFFDSVEKYHQLNKVVDTLELSKDLLKSRRYEIRDSFGKLIQNPLKYFDDKDSRLLTEDGRSSEVLARAEDFFQMEIYGHIKKDEGQLWGTGLDRAKVVDLFARYVSINNLAFNLYSGISNVTYGNSMLLQEAVAGEFFTLKDLGWAFGQYSKEMSVGKGLLELGQRRKDNKLHLWNEFMDTFEDFNQRIRGLNLHSNTVLGQELNSDILYSFNSAGEHELQSTLSLALANTVRFNSEGNPVWKEDFKGEKSTWDKMPTLYDVMEVKDGHLVAKDGFDIKKVRFLFKNKLSFINHGLNGIYNEADRSAMQQNSLGRLAIQFRKFIVPGWNRRFRKQAYFEAPEVYREGFYYTTGMVVGHEAKEFYSRIKSAIQGRQYSYVSQWETLTNHQKANLARSATEVAFMLASTIFLLVLKNLGDDDEDNWALNMMAYQANRYYTEIRFWSSFDEALTILKSPAAGVTQLQNLVALLDLTMMFEYDDGVQLREVKSGPNKGEYRITRAMRNIIPFWRTIDRLQKPNEQLLYYTNKY